MFLDHAARGGVGADIEADHDRIRSGRQVGVRFGDATDAGCNDPHLDHLSRVDVHNYSETRG